MVYRLYWEAFNAFRSVSPIQNLDDNEIFCQLIHQMLEKHLIAIPQLAIGIAETAHQMDPRETDRFMNEMLRSRIGRRLLAEQHLSLSNSFIEKEGYMTDGMIGIVNHRCNAGDVIEKCVDMLKELFKNVYNVDIPQVQIDGNKDGLFVYIPDHLEYILYELLKNSFHHSIDHSQPHLLQSDTLSTQSQELQHPEQDQQKTQNYNQFSNSEIPTVRITVSHAPNQVMFRISDKAGGIEKTVLHNLWSFSHISKQKFMNFRKMTHLAAKPKETTNNIRLGLGLCMSRAYANYWGGSIQVMSMDSYGTDVYLKISTGNQEESLKYIAD